MYNIAEILYANVCTHVFKLNVLDDKKNSWCAPGDCTGKVFVKIRELNRNHQDTSDLSYADVEHFLRFIDKYVSRAVGNHTYARWKKSHQTKTLLDKISASDIACTILVYENSKDVWEEELIIKLEPKKNRTIQLFLGRLRTVGIVRFPPPSPPPPIKSQHSSTQ